MKLLDVNGLSKSFGGVAALRQVQGHSVAGETLGMIGPNGSGKSTLLTLIAGLDTPTQGTVRIAGQDIFALDEDARAALRVSFQAR